MNRKFFVSAILGLFALILLYFQPYKLVVVVGNSMYPTLKDGQILLAKKIDKIEKGDIVVLRPEVDDVVIKRVLYVPGDYYYVLYDHKNADIVLLDDNYKKMKDYIEKFGHDGIFEYKISPNYYFVVGDNREVSDDSRRFGPVDKQFIMYKIVR
jgi:signal peptidase I